MILLKKNSKIYSLCLLTFNININNTILLFQVYKKKESKHLRLVKTKNGRIMLFQTVVFAIVKQDLSKSKEFVGY